LNTSKEVSQELNKLLTATLGDGWKTRFASFDEAVGAAGEEARTLQRKHRELMATRLRQPPKLAEVHLGDKYSGDGYADEGTKESASVFDNTPGGAHCHAERRDEIGREMPNSEEDMESGGGVRGASPGRVEDSLYHPDGRRGGGVVPCKDKPFIWIHRAPRDGGCISC
jgi:hypothetical protein